MQYYAVINGMQAGPFEETALKANGVTASTYVWCEGMDNWVAAGSVPALAPLSAAATPPPVPPHVTPQPQVQANPVTYADDTKAKKRVNSTAIWSSIVSLTLSMIAILVFFGVVSYTNSRTGYYDFYLEMYMYRPESECVPEAGMISDILLSALALKFGIIALAKGRGVKILRIISFAFGIIAMLMSLYTVLVYTGNAHF